MPTPKKTAPAKAPFVDDLEPALDEVIDEDVDLDPNALVDDDEKEAIAVGALSSVEQEEGEDPVVLAKAKQDEDEDEEPKPVVEEISDGLQDEDGIKALERAEKELHEMDFGSGGDAEEPEEEMI